MADQMNEALLSKLLTEELAKVDFRRLARLFKARKWAYTQKDGAPGVPDASRLRETVVELFTDCVARLRGEGDTTWTASGRFLVVVTAVPGCHEVNVWIPAYAFGAAEQAKADEQREGE